MPAKKTGVKEASAAAKVAVKEPAKAETKTETKAAAKKTAVKKTAAKKPAARKTTAKKTVKKETAVRKEEVKKEEVKKTEPVKEAKPAVNMKSVKDYEDIINWKKGEANGMDWLYIEIKADDLLTEVEAGLDNLATVCQAIRNCMLEGDTFIVEPKGDTDANMTVRYYCDNLSPERKMYFQY